MTSQPKDKFDYILDLRSPNPTRRQQLDYVFLPASATLMEGKLDYIQGMGFDCIWITPPVDSNGYMGYAARAADGGF